jgi:DNA-directed RNA polymerase specialized sigma24 family protein
LAEELFPVAKKIGKAWCRQYQKKTGQKLDPEKVDDVISDAFLEALRGYEKAKLEFPTAWLKTVLSRQLGKCLGKGSLDRPKQEPDSEDDSELKLDSIAAVGGGYEEFLRTLDELEGAITPEEKRFLVEHYANGESCEVAANLAFGGLIPDRTARQRMTDLKKKLRPYLAP